MGASARAEVFRKIEPGPRARLAARLYASGAARTKREACEAVGLSYNYLSVLDSAGNEVVKRIQAETEAMIVDETTDISVLIQRLGRKALKVSETAMDSENEHIALKAATDMLDRNPETSKTIKAAITHSMDREDAKILAAALVAGARVKNKFKELAAGDFVQVEVLDGQEDVVIPKGAQGNSSRGTNEVPETKGDSRRDSDEGEDSQGSPAPIRLLRAD